MSRSSFEHCSPTLLEPDGQCERRSAQRFLSLVAAFPARDARSPLSYLDVEDLLAERGWMSPTKRCGDGS